MPTLHLSPSSFGFLADECPRCYYLEVHGLRKRPRTPFPAIFSQIDSAMKRHLADGSHVLDPALPPLQIVAQGRRVISRPIRVSGSDLDLVIRGNYDSLVSFGDDVLGVVDWKTTRVRPDLVEKYGRSLHAYAYCIEHPAIGTGQTVGRLGLGVFEPNHFAFSDGGAARLDGSFSWIDIPRDQREFSSFIRRIGLLLARETVPHASPDCGFCAYAEVA